MIEENPSNDRGLGLRELKKRQSRIAMHRAALELVLEQGLSNVTAEAIAQRAGVSTRTFFNHWRTKESAIIGVVADEGEGIGERLRHQLEDMSPREALYSVLREAITSTPSDASLRELKKQVMAKEPTLHALSSGNVHSVQSDMVEILAAALEGDEAHERAMLSVQIGFAIVRTAFSVSMSRGLDLGNAFDEVLSRYESGDPLV